MKPTMLMFALLLFFGCQNNRDNNNDKDNKATSDEKPDVEIKETRQQDEPAVYIAFREDENGTVYLTDSDDDIDRLIVDLRPLGVEVALLEPKYWREDRCRKMSARKCAVGDCVVGNCELTEIGGWNVCRCR